MNGSGTKVELTSLLEKAQQTSADQWELIQTLLEAVWWVKGELHEVADKHHKSEAKFLEQEARIAALEQAMAALRLSQAPAPSPPAAAQPVPAVSAGEPPAKPVPAAAVPAAAVPAAAVPALAALAIPKASTSPAANSDLLGLDDLFLKKDRSPTTYPSTAKVEEPKESSSDPLMESDPWGERDPDLDAKAEPVGSRTTNKAAIGSRPNDFSQASRTTGTSRSSEVKTKAMPVGLAQRAKAKAKAPDANLTAKLMAKVAEKSQKELTVAALAAKAQTLMGDEGASSPPPPPAKAAPVEAKSPEGETVAKAASRPPAKAPPTALINKIKESESGEPTT